MLILCKYLTNLGYPGYRTFITQTEKKKESIDPNLERYTYDPNDKNHTIIIDTKEILLFVDVVALLSNLFQASILNYYILPHLQFVRPHLDD